MSDSAARTLVVEGPDRYRDSTWLGSGTLAERIANHLQVIDLLCAQGKNDEAAALDERFMERLRWEMS